MNEKWVITKITELEQVSPSNGVKYASDSSDKNFTIGIDSDGKIYIVPSEVDDE